MLVSLNNIIADIGGGVIFFKQIVWQGLTKPCRLQEITDQTWKVTIQSMSTTAMAGFFVGGISTIQFTMQVKQFGALGYLGGLATSGTIREVGPLLIAFMLSGKVGAYTSAELGTMKVTEQIDAIRCLGANPMQELILPRFLGIISSSFFLLVAGLLMSVLGGLLMGIFFAGINVHEYLRHIPTIVAGGSVLSGLFKCFVFAVVLATICTYKGYSASGGAKGVGKAVVNTAVATMVGIVVADWLTSVIGDSVTMVYLGM
ncbi:MAG: ABC transporter permease [Bdellovibrionales bacterium]|nr:ABC transporter permease [Bdellovibrionales bacterium]